MADEDFLYWLVGELGRVIRPVEESLVDEQSFAKLLQKHGWIVDSATFTIISVRSAFAVTDDLDNAKKLLQEIISPAADSDLVGKYIELANILRGILSKLQYIGSVPSPAGISPQLWEEFASELVDSLIAQYIESYHPSIFGLLVLSGVIEEREMDVSGTAGRTNYKKYVIVWERLISAISKPDVILKDVYAWNDSAHPFNFALALERLERFFNLFGIFADLQNPRAELLTKYYDPANPSLPKVKELLIQLMKTDDGNGNSLDASIFVLPITPEGNNLGEPEGIVFGPLIKTTGSAPLEALWPFSLELSGALEINDAIKVEIRPNRIKPVLATGETKIDSHAALIHEPQYPHILFGVPHSTRLQIHGWKSKMGLKGTLADPELEVEVAIDRAELLFDSSKTDSFIQRLLGSELQTVEFGGAIVWSSKTGLHFKGNAGLKLIVPINRTINIVQLDSLALELNASTNGGLNLSMGLTGRATLGPLAVSVDNIGIRLTLKDAPAGKPGLLGDLDLEFGLRPPDGLGLAIDGGGVSGGGYLFLDAEKGEYAGILNLQIKGISVTAIGVLNTKRPDGQEGFSLLIIISSEFQPIQLGFGFKLNGVGGLLGLNRTVAVEVLREGIKNRTLDSILFPPNPIENAPRIISDLKRVFPDAEGRFIFGPMAKIGWGTPTLIIADVGLALEVPDPIRLVLLGRIRAALPKEDLALIQLNMDVLGVVDFEKSTVSIDATLYDSRLLVYTLSGDMALRAGWGANPLFALSVGGLNPRFQAPPGFPTLSRLQVSMGVGNNPRLNLQAYLAITSNTVQFGALLELYAEAFGFNIKGHLGFDCLFQFDPFEFIADISAGVAFRKGNRTLAAVNLQATLSGPRPWRARGKASISLLFIDASVSFDQQWGDASKVTLPEINVWEQLKPALEDPRNWSAVLPPVSSRSVGYRNIDNDPQEVVVVDPFGSLTMRQKVAPLNLELTKFGNSAPSSGNSYFNIKEVSAGGIPLPTGKEYDLFAPAQFKEMSDDQKLTQPEFERMESGISVGAGGAKTADKDTIKEAEMIFETYIIDLKGKKQEDQKIKVSSDQAATLSEFGALKRSRWWNSGEDKYFPDVLEEAPAVTMEDEYFAIADKRDLKRRDDILKGSIKLTRSEAYDIMNEHIRNHPEDREILQIMPAYEVIQAA